MGPSHIPSWAFDNSSSLTVPHSNFLVNYCIKISCFTNKLKQEHIVPLYKNDDPEEPKNDRPISITPCFSKVIKTILRNKICYYHHDYTLLSKNQYGFTRNYSTIDSPLLCTELIKNRTYISNL